MIATLRNLLTFICYILLVTLHLNPSEALAQVQVPGYTAYIHPDPWGARVRENPKAKSDPTARYEQGVMKWTEQNPSVQWWGYFRHGGSLQAKVLVAPAGDTTPAAYAETCKKLTLKVRDQTHTPEFATEGTQPTLLNFGTFDIQIAEPTHLLLELIRDSGAALRVIELQLDGPATNEVHFNLKERRNAASVHLSYPVPNNEKVDAFYTEVTAIEEPVGTFYMACGWHRGYFGMQVNSKSERRIIFSVWDSGNEAIDRNKVTKENRVQLIEKGKDVFAGDFGNEGTGGHSHLKTLWKTGSKQRFLVTAKPTDPTHTTYTGHWFRPNPESGDSESENVNGEWMVISSWNAPKEGGYMRGLHSFSENFLGENGHLVRKALYGNQWYRTADGEWHEITQANFSHDPTGKEDRLDRMMGVESNQFFLRHGGFLDGFTKYGTPMHRNPTSAFPEDVKSLVR